VLLAPLSALSYRRMYLAWVLLSVVALLVAGWVFTVRYSYPRAWVIVPLALPFVHLDLVSLQTTCALLFVLVLGERSSSWLGVASALRLYPALLLARLRGREIVRAVAVTVFVAIGPVLLVGLHATWRWLAESSPANLAAWFDFHANASLAALLGHLGVPFLAGAFASGFLAIAVGRRLGYWEMMPFVVLASPLSWPNYAVLCLPTMLRRGRWGLASAIGVSFSALTFTGWIGSLSILLLGVASLRRPVRLPESVPA
jgi:hypothetical protein